MKRILALWLPNWPVQRLVRDQPELADCAVVLYEKDARYGNRVKTCSATATDQGVRPNMPLAEAQTLMTSEAPQPSAEPTLLTPNSLFSWQQSSDQRERTTCAGAVAPIWLRPCRPTQFVLHDPHRDREALTELAEWCERFSPTVGLDQADEPDSLLMDVSGLAHLFGGEQGLARTIVTALQQRRLAARVAIADTLRAAWAVARWGDCIPHSQSATAVMARPVVGVQASACLAQPEGCTPADTSIRLHLHSPFLVPPGDVTTVDSLPLQALQLPERTAQQLQRLGIHAVGQLRQLSRASLAARFGDLLAERLDQLTGSMQQVIVSHRRQAEFAVCWSFEHATARHDAIECVLEELLRRLSCQLVERGQGVLQLKCQFVCKDRRPLAIDIGLFQPTVNAQHLAALAKMQLALLRLPDAVEEIRIAALSTAPCQQKQKELFADSPRDNPAQLALLVERLSNRMGRERVVCAQLQAESLVESAYQYLPLTGEQPSAAASGLPAQPVHAPMLRPLRLLEPPHRIEMIGIALDGPPAVFHYGRRQYRVARCFGPERIETGWWRGPSARRDYYRVETETGNRLWLFRNLQDKRWFLHGEF